jgi:hypothetical protein
MKQGFHTEKWRRGDPYLQAQVGVAAPQHGRKCHDDAALQSGACTQGYEGE